MNAPADAALQALARAVGDRLAAEGATLVTAESCTGGWIAKACTDIAGSSRWFQGGLVVYSNALKAALLGVPDALLDAHGAVSEPVVAAMAQGALERTGATLSIAVSGVAGPEGGTPAKPVGTVWLAWARRGSDGTIRVTARREQFGGGREDVRRWTVQRALEGLLAP